MQVNRARVKRRHLKIIEELLPASTAPQAQPAPRVVDDQTKTRQLIALCDKDQPLSASDVAAIQQLLAAGASVACGIGQSKWVNARLPLLERLRSCVYICFFSFCALCFRNFDFFVPALFPAICQEHVGVVQMLISAGADVNVSIT